MEDERRVTAAKLTSTLVHAVPFAVVCYKAN